MKVLVVYPHGLGDCVLATPALRAYKAKTGNFVGFAMLERFRSSELFKHNPNVDELFWTKDAWNDFPNFRVGCAAVEQQCRQMAADNGYDDIVFVKHSRNGSKILDCAKALGVELTDVHTDVYIAEEDRERAVAYTLPRPFGFVQSSTGVPVKDLPPGFGKRWLRLWKNIPRVVEIGVDFRYDELNINVQFAIMELADAVCLPDSVFYHACCALDKRVDFVYFAKGPGIYNRVKPLHEVEERVVYRLP